MSDGERSKGWWQTLAGVITSVTAAITALAGLIVAIDQTGWFEPRTSPPAASPLVTSEPAAPQAATSEPARSREPSAAASGARSAYAVALPSLRDYRLGGATFTLLAAEVTPRNAETNALQIRVRMRNHDPYDANFWDQSFRLSVNGMPMPPESNLNELVPGDSAKEGEVLFAIPHGTAKGALKITHHDESTEIPLAFAPPR